MHELIHHTRDGYVIAALMRNGDYVSNESPRIQGTPQEIADKGVTLYATDSSARRALKRITDRQWGDLLTLARRQDEYRLDVIAPAGYVTITDAMQITTKSRWSLKHHINAGKIATLKPHSVSGRSYGVFLRAEDVRALAGVTE